MAFGPRAKGQCGDPAESFNGFAAACAIRDGHRGNIYNNGSTEQSSESLSVDEHGIAFTHLYIAEPADVTVWSKPQCIADCSSKSLEQDSRYDTIYRDLIGVVCTALGIEMTRE
jgi:hypothetical protein